MIKTCPVICLETGEMFDKIADVAKYYNIDGASVSKVCKGKQKTAKGMRFRYIVDNKIQYLENDKKIDFNISLIKIEIPEEEKKEKEKEKVNKIDKIVQEEKEKLTGQEKSFLFWLNKFISESKYNNEKELDISLAELYNRIINDY